MLEQNHLMTKFGLTEREQEIALEIAKGHMNLTVGNNLFIHEQTVKFHATNIYKKMGIKTRSALIAYCLSDQRPAVPVANPYEFDPSPFIPEGQRPLPKGSV